MEWIISQKGGEGEILDDYQDLMHQRFTIGTKEGQLSGIQSFVARAEINELVSPDAVIDAQIRTNHPEIDESLKNLQDQYGADYLKKLSDREFYELYKRHTA